MSASALHRLELLLDRLYLCHLGTVGGIPALCRHFVVQGILHGERIAQCMTERLVHVAGAGLDHAVYIQVANALFQQQDISITFLSSMEVTSFSITN